MRRLALVAAALCLLVFVSARAAEDFTGKWSGSFVATSPTGESHDDTIALDLKHKGTDLTGTAGPNVTEQWPLKGTVDGNKLTFQVTHENGMVIKFALTFAEGHLKGEAVAEREGQKMQAKIDAQRTKSGG